MATRRLTRLQSKRQLDLSVMEENCHQLNRKSSTALGEIVDNKEDRNVSSFSGVVGRRSFPLDHEANEDYVCQRKISKTDTTSTKQKRTFAVRATNVFMDDKITTQRSQGHPRKSNDIKVLKRTSTPWVISSSASDDTMKGNDDNNDDNDDDDDADDVEDDMDNEGECCTEEELLCDEAMFNAAEFSQDDMRPEAPQPFDSPMEFLANEIEKKPKQLPNGVVDIDFESDSLRTCEYASDIMDYLLEREKQWMLVPGFLNKSPEVTPRMRAVLMDWLVQVQAHEELKEETLHLCVWLIDRFLSLVEVRMPRLQLVGITCLLVASKVVERFAPQISTLCHLTDNTFRLLQVIRYENLVLRKLDFCLFTPVCTTFLDRFLQVHEDEDAPFVGLLARYLLDLSIISHRLATVLPSLLAAGTLYVARRLVSNSKSESTSESESEFKAGQAWSPSLQHYTTYSEMDLHGVVDELAGMLIKAPTSKYQGSRNKYNTDYYSFISDSEFIQRDNIVRFESEEGTPV